MNEYSVTKQRGRICAFNMLMCAVVIGLAGTQPFGNMTELVGRLIRAQGEKTVLPQ